MNSDIFNLSFFTEITDSDTEMQEILLNMFMEQAQKEIEEIKHHFNQGDYHNWQKLAHKLYGSAANIGAFQLAKVCDYAHSTNIGDLEDIDYIHSQIISSHDELQPIISQLLLNCQK
jgi:HPt (histidine-containing phosphotransfer) domain-containing protein